MKTTRRDFLKVSAALGGGLALEFSFPLTAMAAKGLPSTEVNAWVVIHPDDRDWVNARYQQAHAPQGDGWYEAEFRIRRADTVIELAEVHR